MTAQTTSGRVRTRLHKITGGHLKGVRTLSVAFLRLDIIEEISYPLAFALSELGILVPVVAYFFIGELVGGSQIVGGDYFTFAVVGISVTVILGSALSGFGGALQRSQNRGQFQFLLAEPIPWLFLPFVMNLYRALLGIVNGLLVLGMGIALSASIRLEGLPAFLILVILGVGASGAIGILAASVMVVAKRSQPLLTLYNLAASLLGGALFSLDQLPDWLRYLSYAIPHTYVINATRTVLMEDPGTFTIDFQTALLALIGFNIVALGLGMRLFSGALQFARREGLLGGY